MSEAEENFDLDALQELSSQLPQEPEASEEETATAPETPVEAETPEVDPQVAKAQSKGWKPLEEFDGDPDEWVDAGEFIRRQPLFERARAAERRAKDLEKKLDSTTKFVEGIEERVRKKTLEEIDAKRRQAVEDGDVEAFQEADKEYQQAQQAPEVESEEEQEQQPELPRHVKDFAERNAGWFETDWAMTNDVLQATQFYINKGKAHEEALAQAEKDIRRKYADRFENPNKQRRQTVSEGTKEQRPKSRGYNDLNAEQKAVYAAMKGHMSLDEYVKELESQGAFDA